MNEGVETRRTSPGAAAHGGLVTWQGAVARWDRALFDTVARRHWPGGDRVLPRLSRAANHGLLWGGMAAGLALFGSATARRAALHGVASLALASATVNSVGKWTVRRARPLTEGVPAVRLPARQPWTTSFPSGHSASAFAFLTGVATAAPSIGAVVAPVAASVAFSRVYTGVHYPADVLAGAALGVGAGLAVRRLARGAGQLRTAPGEERPAAAPALPDGAGLTVVVNTASGGSLDAAALREALPAAEVVECTGEELTGTLAEAAAGSAALGVCGGDGTVVAAATAALRAGIPLAVFPGGTLNHFAADLGLAVPEDTCRAVTAGEAVRVSVGRFTPLATAAPAPAKAAAPAGGAAEPSGDGRSGPEAVTGPGYFLNTFSIGVYPDLLRHRLRWAPRIGSGPAALLAAWRVLRDQRPVRLRLAGRTVPVWLLFTGNGTYHGAGPVPRRRLNLDEPQLDLRVVLGGGHPGPRLLAAALTGPLTRSPAHFATHTRALRVTDIPPGTALAYDGEYALAPEALVLDKLPAALTVYRPRN
ncbi:bifunctional phosphatase PAP2/diacylglycerol kinase family protein [Streptomyces sp. NPDC048603]|uniref:bifunctional phosphatase PAP2/diacylglycerol kinase family protein n=1 Tax=Streptomyces sp. NPDC048603 TaxID=3365577 RepID=UPI003711F5D6